MRFFVNNSRRILHFLDLAVDGQNLLFLRFCRFSGIKAVFHLDGHNFIVCHTQGMTQTLLLV